MRGSSCSHFPFHSSNAFRDHPAMGPLQSCYRLLGLQFFEFLVQSLQASQPPDRVLLESVPPPPQAVAPVPKKWGLCCHSLLQRLLYCQILFITRAAAPAINTQLKRGNFDTKVWLPVFIFIYTHTHIYIMYMLCLCGGESSVNCKVVTPFSSTGRSRR